MKKTTFLIFVTLTINFSIFAQTEATNQIPKYRRSSLYTLMIDDQTRPYANVIKASFEKGPIPEKFNDHNLGTRVIPSTDVKDESANITAFLETNKIARDIVAKWFNRSEKGGFNMDLVKTRGSYDAGALDIAKAKASQRGLEILADAGEELIKNTFVLVNDYNYVSKEEVAKKASSFLSNFWCYCKLCRGSGCRQNQYYHNSSLIRRWYSWKRLCCKNNCLFISFGLE